MSRKKHLPKGLVKTKQFPLVFNLTASLSQSQHLTITAKQADTFICLYNYKHIQTGWIYSTSCAS